MPDTRVRLWGWLGVVFGTALSVTGIPLCVPCAPLVSADTFLSDSMWRNKTQKPAEGGDKPDVDAGRVAMEAPAPFRVATYNIRCPIDKGANAWPNRVERVRALIKKHGFDLIGLQEATSGQIDDLLSDEWAYVGVGRDDGKRGGEASCIFYKKDRFEVRETDTFWLSETPSVPGSKSWATDCTRICTWARMADRKTGRDFYFFNTHLDHRSEVARENGMSLILTRMTRIAQGRPVLLAGDMNATPGTEPIARASAVLHEAYKLTQKPHVGPVATSNGFKFDRVPTAKIDHIFVSDGVKVLTHATYDDSENGLYPSDHFPVAADVVVE